MIDVIEPDIVQFHDLIVLLMHDNIIGKFMTWILMVDGVSH